MSEPHLLGPKKSVIGLVGGWASVIVIGASCLLFGCVEARADLDDAEQTTNASSAAAIPAGTFDIQYLGRWVSEPTPTPGEATT